jgi:hypothetical protein
MPKEVVWVAMPIEIEYENRPGARKNALSYVKEIPYKIVGTGYEVGYYQVRRKRKKGVVINKPDNA